MQVSHGEVTSSNVTRAFRTGRIRKTFHKASTYTLLDAAALATTAPLDLSDPATAPDFTAVSFYFRTAGTLVAEPST
jgi:selenocysteine lyase/cysteine desulfurase